MVGAAPLLLAACGGGGAGDPSATTRVATTYRVATTPPPLTTPPPSTNVTGTGTSMAPANPPTTQGTTVSSPPMSGGSRYPPASGGSSPVSLSAGEVCTDPVDAALADVLPMDIGATGPVVVTVQQGLQAEGFDLGPSGADGRFGQQTDDAYRAWERAVDGVETGVVCQEDYDALVGTDPGD